MAKASNAGSSSGKPKKNVKKSVEATASPSKSTTKESTKQTAQIATKTLGYPARIRSFLHDVRGETRRVTWPSRKQLIASTSAVLVAILILGLYIGLLDWGFRSIAEALNL